MITKAELLEYLEHAEDVPDKIQGGTIDDLILAVEHADTPRWHAYKFFYLPEPYWEALPEEILEALFYYNACSRKTYAERSADLDNGTAEDW